MPRLLYIGSGSPWSGGAGFLVRQNLFLGALGQIADLHLAMFDCQNQSVPGYVKQLTLLTKPTKQADSKIKKLADDLLSPEPRMIRSYDLSEPRRQILGLNPAGFDAVFSYRIDFGYFAGVLDHPCLILDIDDPEHIRSQRRLATSGGQTDRRTMADLEKLRRFEVQAVAKAKLAMVCQEGDRQGWTIPPDVVPNCVVVPENPQRNVSKPIVLFIGNCAGGPASPNVDAVQFFLSEIWSKILEAIPAAEFHLVGAASDLVKQLVAKAPRSYLRGFVDDLAAVYSESALSIAPIRFGTGTRIKILDSFAHACPVVSTLAGAEGIPAVPGREIELAAAAGDFADRTIELLNNRSLAENIGRGGYALARSRYDMVAQQALLVRKFNAFLGSNSAVKGSGK